MCRYQHSASFGRRRITVSGSVCESVICSGCHSKTPQTGWLKEQKLIFSQLWNLEVQGEGASRTGLWWGLSFWLSEDHLLPMSWYRVPCVYGESGCSSVSSSSFEDSSPVGLGPSFILNYLPVALSPNIVTLGLGASPCEFEGYTVHFITLCRISLCIYFHSETVTCSCVSWSQDCLILLGRIPFLNLLGSRRSCYLAT